jgi:hypothetical protein
MPRAAGPYSVTVVVTEAGYEVHEAGVLRHVYRHRSPFTRLDRVAADDTWEVREVDGGASGGGGGGGGASAVSDVSAGGRRWELRSGASRDGSCNWRASGSDILFHFNPRCVGVGVWVCGCVGGVCVGGE